MYVLHVYVHICIYINKSMHGSPLTHIDPAYTLALSAKKWRFWGFAQLRGSSTGESVGLELLSGQLSLPVVGIESRLHCQGLLLHGTPVNSGAARSLSRGEI